MESLLEMSEAAMESNIIYYKSMREKFALMAIEALAEETKWKELLAQKN